MMPPNYKETEADQLLERAKAHGLTPDIEPGFLLWVANEVWEKREVGNFMVLIERAPELVKIYRAERSRESSERGPMAEPIKVRHADLERASDNSAYRSQCPKCADGILPIRRDLETLQLEALDFCLGCGQAFIYEDIEDLR